MAAHTISPPAVATVRRYFEASLLLLLCCGFCTVAATGRVGPAFIGLVGIALAFRAFLLLTNRNWTIAERWTGLLTVSYVGFYAVDFLFLTGLFVESTVHLVLFAMVLKLFSVHRDRDYVYLAVLALLQVLAASVLTVDAVFLVGFLAFALLAILVFITFELKRAAENAENSARDTQIAKLSGSLTITAVTLAFAILVGATVIFFLLPRMSHGYFSRFAPRSRGITGFSDTVRLGAIGDLQQSDAVVAYIQPYGNRHLPPDFKLRGVSLSLFDGAEWVNPTPHGPMERAVAGTFNIAGLRARLASAAGESEPRLVPKMLRYRVIMEPTSTNVFFGAPRLIELSGNYRAVYVDAGGAVYSADANRPITAYTVVSDLSESEPERLRRAGDVYSSAIAIRYLQLPKLDPRVAKLARQITEGAPTAYDRAVRLSDHLQRNYGYTLTPGVATGRDPLAYFLFERKQGHCEYFASSMAVMLRTLGIPARVVNGFRGAQFNRISNSYVVRGRDAHSWVEAYFPGGGWVSFDPTPASRDEVVGGLSSAAMYMDAMREFWREWIINYDFSHQRTLAVDTATASQRGLRSTRQSLEQWYRKLLVQAERTHVAASRAPMHVIVVISGGLLLIFLLGNTRPILAALRRTAAMRNPDRAPSEAAAAWYARMEKIVARRGWKKPPSATPNEFVASVTDASLRRVLAEFTSAYERARFGQSAADAQLLAQLYDRVRTTK